MRHAMLLFLWVRVALLAVARCQPTPACGAEPFPLSAQQRWPDGEGSLWNWTQPHALLHLTKPQFSHLQKGNAILGGLNKYR